MSMLDVVVEASQQAKEFPDLIALLLHSLKKAPPEGLVLEFGVGGGNTLSHLAAASSRLVHAFDSFHGLPEHWNQENPKGKFDEGGVPPARARCANSQLHIGLFADTVPAFFAEHPGPVAFAHIDCDLYSSTRVALDAIATRVIPGTILNFNEFWNYPEAHLHEAKAFAEFVLEHGFTFECIGRHRQTYSHAVFRLSPPVKECS